MHLIYIGTLELDYVQAFLGWSTALLVKALLPWLVHCFTSESIASLVGPLLY